jgi:peroxiredoxin
MHRLVQKTLPVVLLMSYLLIFDGVAPAEEPVRTLPLGAQAPDFELPGVDGKNHNLSEFDDARVLVIVFTCNHCPTAQAYENRLIQLARNYRDRGVQVVAISPNDPLAVRLDELGYTDLSDSLEEMKIRAKDKGFPFPYLYDGETQQVSRAFGALATPHLFIFDEDRKLQYNGRFDDSEKGDIKSPDAINAIEALLAGRQVPVAKTRVFGCSTKWASKRESAQEALRRWNREPVELKNIDAASVRQLAQNDSKKYRLINVWATWCGPCVTELPELVTINRMYRGREFEMITISMDSLSNRDRALEILQKHHVACQNYIFASDDRDALAESLDPKWPGPVPYTILVAPGGEILYRQTDSINPLELKQAIVEKLGRTYQ